MKFSMRTLLPSNIQKIKSQSGFTMIELLIVIAILGILAIAVLSAINPIEQINRGRDTGSRSDAEQLLNAIDRYNAFQGYNPWTINPTAVDTLSDSGGLLLVDGNWSVDSSGTGTGTSDCAVLDRLSGGDTSATAVTCESSDELKLSYVTRITADDANPLYIWNQGGPGDSTYVCFTPKSGAFKTEAEARCADVDTLPDDFPADGCTGDAEGTPYVCIP